MFKISSNNKNQQNSETPLTFKASSIILKNTILENGVGPATFLDRFDKNKFGTPLLCSMSLNGIWHETLRSKLIIFLLRNHMSEKITK